jgi:cyclophilin family peptidyl-prolyl cis-trans isomerase
MKLLKNTEKSKKWPQQQCPLLLTFGVIRMQMHPEAAPVTVDYIQRCVESGLYDNTSFYRSDFVIQVSY